MKKHKISQTKQIAKEYMTLLPHTRNSNLNLLREVWTDEADLYNLDIPTIQRLVDLIQEQKMTNLITLARTRQDILNENPEWRTNNPDEDERDFIRELNNAR